MNDRSCWNCGHAHGQHTIAGGCSFERGGEHCDCREYEDGEYRGEQRKRDTYTNSDTRRRIKGATGSGGSGGRQ